MSAPGLPLALIIGKTNNDFNSRHGAAAIIQKMRNYQKGIIRPKMDKGK